jgi:hypothetical protein
MTKLAFREQPTRKIQSRIDPSGRVRRPGTGIRFPRRSGDRTVGADAIDRTREEVGSVLFTVAALRPTEAFV